MAGVDANEAATDFRDAAKVAKRQEPVHEAIASHERADAETTGELDALTAIVEELENKLQPVLRPFGPERAVDDGQVRGTEDDRPSLSPLAERIASLDAVSRRNTLTVGQLGHRIRVVLERLEV